MTTKNIKPLGRKSYGSIGHLPNSRLGPSDSCVSSGQAKICTEKARDNKDFIVVQEKLDGANVGVVLLNGEIVPLSRAGYHASTSPFEQHHMFADWVALHEQRFRSVLREGERLCGEWIAQAHGTIYPDVREPFVAFDIMQETTRVTTKEFYGRVRYWFETVVMLHAGGPLSIQSAMQLLLKGGRTCDVPEGVVYRVERNGKVDFLAKYVRKDKVDGCFLSEVSGKESIWNWRPTK